MKDTPTPPSAPDPEPIRRAAGDSAARLAVWQARLEMAQQRVADLQQQVANAARIVDRQRERSMALAQDADAATCWRGAAGRLSHVEHMQLRAARHASHAADVQLAAYREFHGRCELRCQAATAEVLATHAAAEADRHDPGLCDDVLAAERVAAKRVTELAQADQQLHDLIDTAHQARASYLRLVAAVTRGEP